MGVGIETPNLLRKFFITIRGDRIFIHPFFSREELSPDIVAILECTKRMKSAIQIFPDNSPQNPGKELGST